MPVLVTTEIDPLSCSLQQLEKTAETLLMHTGRKDNELSILLVDDRRMTELNSSYRGKGTPTNVLSFPMLDPEEEESGMPLLLGDIVISIDTAEREATEMGRSLDDYLAILLVHGYVHLLGFDHEQGEEEEAAMRAMEKKFLDLLAVPGNGLSPLGESTDEVDR